MDKGSLSRRLCVRHVSVHGDSVGVFVTDTHVSKADKSPSDGAAVAPLSSILPEGSGQEIVGRWGT